MLVGEKVSIFTLFLIEIELKEIKSNCRVPFDEEEMKGVFCFQSL